MSKKVAPINRVIKPTRKSTNRLSHVKVHQLYSYLESNKSEIQNSTLNLAQLTNYVSDKIGFAINATTLERAMKDHSIVRKRGKKDQFKAAILELEERIKNLKTLLED